MLGLIPAQKGFDMASLIVSYFDNVDLGVAGFPLGSETITTSTTSAAGNAIDTRAEVCGLYSDTAHYVTISRHNETKVATAGNSFYVPANQVYWLRTFVAAGQTIKISAITA
jgi:hypothetical protein